MYTITKRFEFSASHRLYGLPPEHKCSRLHGHSYSVEIEMKSGTLDSTGFVRDYGDLDVVKEWIDSTLDHRHLNDIVSFAPTAENLAFWIFQIVVSLCGLEHLAAIRVMESTRTMAEFRL